MTALLQPEPSQLAAPTEPDAEASAEVGPMSDLNTRRRALVIAFTMMSALTIGLALLSLVLGSVRVPLYGVIDALIGRTDNPAWEVIVRDVRGPRLVTAVLAGAALSVAGLQLQTLFRNPLADPSVIGVTSGASLGVAIVVLGAGGGSAGMLAGLGPLADVGVTLAAAVGSLAVLLIVLAAAQAVPSRLTVLVIGVLIGSLVSGMVSLLVHFASVDAARSYFSWGLGSFRGTAWDDLVVMGPAVGAGVAIAGLNMKSLDALLLGERTAATLGVRTARVRAVTIVSAALLAGAATAFCGPVAFIGVAVPHLARAVVRDARHRVLVPACVLLGAAVALACELIAQWPGNDRVLPLNAITAVFGAPVVIAVLVGSQRRSAHQGMAE